MRDRLIFNNLGEGQQKFTVKPDATVCKIKMSV